MLIEQNLKQTLSQRIDPKLIQANNILQLSHLELQQAIEQELAENPALEIPEEDPCEGCDMPRSLCIDCSFKKAATTEAIDYDITVHDLEPAGEYLGDIEGDGDYLSNIEAEVTLQEHLRILLASVVPSDQQAIGDYLISNIDDNGYLSCPVSEAAEEFDVTEDEVEAVLALIQTFEPLGVGARDLQECMCIQLEHLVEDGRGSELALGIVRDHWDDMLARKFNRLARRFKVTADEVEAATQFIQKSLNPYPGNAFRSPWVSKPETPKVIVRPDIIVRRTPAGYEVEIVQSERYLLGINSHYRQVYHNLKSGKVGKYSRDEKKHISEFVERADLFIRNINQRRKTLRLITKAIVEFQQGYIETGSRLFLRPLTRTRIARAIKMHESTVSRATANKYVQLPSEEVVSFDFFFDGSVSVKDVILEMIASEDPRNPLSDQMIAEKLQERGLDIARRTVVKYREAQKILSSRQRRR